MPKTLGGFVTGMPTDNHAVFIDDDGLAETKLADTGSHRFDCVVIESGIVFVGFDAGKFAFGNPHIQNLRAEFRVSPSSQRMRDWLTHFLPGANANCREPACFLCG